MGSALSGLLADFYVDFLEKEIFSGQYEFFTKHILFYGRYVDDILIVHDSSEANIKAIHNIFNTIDVLKFTMEKEKNNTINFLDLTISKDFTNKQLRFNIYRKPTTTDIVIPNRSYTNTSHKHASF